MNRAESFLDRASRLDMELRVVEQNLRLASANAAVHPKTLMMLVRRQDTLWGEWHHMWCGDRRKGNA